jgi:hypothetical protein
MHEQTRNFYITVKKTVEVSNFLGYFEGQYCLHLQGQTVQDPEDAGIKVLRSLKTLGTTHPLAQCHVPEHMNLQQHCCENMKSHKEQVFSNAALRGICKIAKSNLEQLNPAGQIFMKFHIGWEGTKICHQTEVWLKVDKNQQRVLAAHLPLLLCPMFFVIHSTFQDSQRQTRSAWTEQLVTIQKH